MKGSDEPFEEVSLEEVEMIEKLPNIDHNVVWKRKEESSLGGGEPHPVSRLYS